MAVHFDSSSGLNTITACGKSLHGWNLKRPKHTTENKDDVTCRNCIKALTK